jgi:phage-related tail fiber protein
VTVDAKGRVTAGTSQAGGSGNASDLAVGTIPAARFPAFTGDVTSTLGSTELSLSYTGVPAGTYNSVTVDSKGRVVTGTATTLYSADEIDNKLASKIGAETANAPLGYVKLNENGKIESSFLSSMALNNSTVVSTLVARNALNARVGDIAIVAGTVNKSYVLSALPPTSDSNWLEMLNPNGGVTAINGLTGVVSFGYDNISGTVPPANLPPFVGDVSSNGNIVSLIPTGVTAGTYNKVSVDAKGRVTSASNVSTLADLGIADALSTALLPTGDATASQLVKGDDSRLTNSRPPTTHNHSTSDISGLYSYVDNFVQSGIVTLRNGVPTAGDSLNKLYNLIVTGINEIIVPNLSARDALDIPNTKTQVFVENDGDGEWALYKATSTGVGASFVKLSDPNIINAIVGVTVESTANKDADTTLSANSDVKYPSQKAVKTYVDQHLVNKVSTYDFSTALSTKADTSYVNSVADNKADKSYVDIGLNSKLDATMLPVGTSNASVDQLVKGNDSRLTDARLPLPHTASYITNFDTAVNSLVGSAITSAMQSYSGGVQSINNLTGHLTVNKVTVGLNFVDNTSDVDKPLSSATTIALAGKESIANKNVINGYVGLNSVGKIDALYLPVMTMNNRFVRETLEERNLLNAAVGDIAIVTGMINKTYILNALPASSDNSWLEMSSPLDGVTSVNGLTGTVSLTLSDIGGNIPLTKLPSFIGDISSSAGSNVLTLSASGVTAGTYNQVTVDAKGRVTSASNIDVVTRDAGQLAYGILPAERLPQFSSPDIYSSAGTNVLNLSQTGVSPGTYNNVTVDSKGRVISASNEQYYNTNASTLDTGTLPIARLPAFVGDITTSVGSNSTVLSNTGVVAGTYNNVTVDRKGRVTAGTTTAVYTTAQVDTKLAAKLDVSKANQANGYVSLNSSLKIDQTYLPAITINSRYVASSLTERNALSARIGDLAIVGGEINKTYILNALPASVDESWLELINPLSGVMAINGKTGIVAIDISEMPGTLNVSSLPSFTGGDVTSNDGSSVLTLKNSGVTAGLYNVVQVNAKGLITSASNATTLDGIGITDAYTKTEVNNLLSPKLTSTSSLNANRLSTGTIPDGVLSNMIDAGAYVAVSVDTKGRVIGGLRSNNTPNPGQVFFASDTTQGYWGAVPSGTNASTLSTGTLSSSLLPNSGVSAGVYNTVTVDAKGRVTTGISIDNTPSPNQIFVTSSASNGSWIDIPSSTNASALTSGTLSSSLLPNSGVTAGRYAIVNVDSKGRVTTGMSATNNAVSGQIFVANSSGSGTWTTIPPATNASELTTGTLSSTLLPNTGIIDGNYVGLTIDGKGRAISGITATNTPLPGQVFVAQTTSSGKWMTYSGGGGGGGASSDASLLTSGTIDPARLPTSGISASSITTGTLSASQLPTTESAGTYTSVVVDDKGRVTGGGKLDSIQLSILKRNRVPVTYNASVMSDTTGTPNTISLSILKRDKSIVSYNVSL